MDIMSYNFIIFDFLDFFGKKSLMFLVLVSNVLIFLFDLLLRSFKTFILLYIMILILCPNSGWFN